MNKYTLLFLLFLSSVAYSQKNSNRIIWLRPNEELKPSQNQSDGNYTTDDRLNQTFKKRKVIHYKQALPFAKNPKLKELYEVEYNDSNDSLLYDLKNSHNKFRDVREIPLPIPTYDPTDYMWYLTGDDGYSYLWHLKIIQADKAWNLTKGNPNIKIAIIDTDFDLAHPDLAGQFDPTYDPYTNIPLFVSGSSHGTTVASFVAAKTDGGGQLASVGFNCKLIGYTWDYGLAKALHASNVMHADVLSISWFNSCSPNPDDALIIKEILDNGTIIVAAAGNGSQHCGGGEIYPFASTYDDRLIKVSSTSKYDKHQYIINGVDLTHSQYPGVDICAPGYCTMGAVSTINNNGSTNTWPYYGCCSGTSFATPIAAGVCALMKSVNPCLTPAQVQSLIKSTADPIVDASLFPGQVGAGRINAYNAVLQASLACTPSTPTSIYGFCCNGNEFGSESIYDFNVNYSTNQGVNQFNWVVAGGTILEGQGTNTITVKTSKVTGSPKKYFDVSVKVGNSCGWSSYLWRTGYVTSGIGPAMFTVYPNPASSEVTISVSDANPISAYAANTDATISSIKIVDSYGYSKRNKKYDTGLKTVTLNVADLQKGIYLVVINNGLIQETHNLIIN